VLTLQVIAAGLLLLGSGLVIHTVIALDGPSFRAARPSRGPKLVRAASRARRQTAPQRRAA
jgi:hypothetical protein